MTAIDAVSVFLPRRRVPIESLAGALRLSEMQVRLFRRFHGLTEVRRDPELSLTDLLRHAATGLTALRGREHRVRFVLYARAFPVVAPYPVNPLHDVCRALGLGHALAFTVTQQSCASALTAIDVAGRLLAAEPHRPGHEPLALILTGEKAFTRDAQFIPETSVFSEGASACLVSAHGPRDRLLSYACAQRGEFDVAGGESPARFQREYRPALAAVIDRALAEAGTTLADLRLVLPHNVNLMTWKRLCKLIGLPLDRVLLENITETGHVFCADAFANYRTARDRDLLAPGDRYLVAAVGAGDGATFAAMVFEH
ncbi:3-oxoacyl-[acyl-carrier-protein] synthase III C-terminal domain-containing protein [Micromonospora sp. NBS 11-29]|uniref:3-oxoacyl-[acyl-carrier-protein] synthase III C-terminal domain-containing protein n=1 Tax=Micromonospora sp. NBS 11-29 TaxID=1960879 RepID=UPI000B7725D2|nr:3-oxoacyl-[acyl-carrier-protein] synthase III C-terminal domain-containing protein [Micromonospora sp. NBS 11-29]